MKYITDLETGKKYKANYDIKIKGLSQSNAYALVDIGQYNGDWKLARQSYFDTYENMYRSLGYKWGNANPYNHETKETDYVQESVNHCFDSYTRITEMAKHLNNYKFS